MRIDFTTFGVDPPDKGNTSRTGEAAQSGKAASRTGSSPANNAAVPDQTRFSFDQAQVQSLQAQVLAQPEIREAKVKSLRQAIDNGEYTVPPGLVADALVNEGVFNKLPGESRG